MRIGLKSDSTQWQGWLKSWKVCDRSLLVPLHILQLAWRDYTPILDEGLEAPRFNKLAQSMFTSAVQHIHAQSMLDQDALKDVPGILAMQFSSIHG